jgi:hypothetical protein
MEEALMLRWYEARLRTVEEALGASPTWQEVLIQVQYAACGDEPVEQGPRYVVRVPASQLRHGWWQRGGGNEVS